MVDYHQLGQVEDDALSENEKHEASQKSSFLQRHFTGKVLIILHIIIFALYALSILYFFKRGPLDCACDYKHSTHCQ
jgi:hypothetical protein